MTEFGKNVELAFDIVRQLHRDLNILFRELHTKEFSGQRSVFGSEVLKTLTRDVKRTCWMPEGVFRFYWHPERVGLVEGVACRFFNTDARPIPEPILLASQIQYKRAEDFGKPFEWDCWDLFSIGDEWPLNGSVVEIGEERLPDKFRGRIERARVKGIFVYDVRGRDVVTSLITEVRAPR